MSETLNTKLVDIQNYLDGVKSDYLDGIKRSNKIEDVSAGQIVFSSDPKEDMTKLENHLYHAEKFMVKNAIKSVSKSFPIDRVIGGDASMTSLLDEFLDDLYSRPVGERLSYVESSSFNDLFDNFSSDIVNGSYFSEDVKGVPVRVKLKLLGLYEKANSVDNVLRKYDFSLDDF